MRVGILAQEGETGALLFLIRVLCDRGFRVVLCGFPHIFALMENAGVLSAALAADGEIPNLCEILFLHQSLRPKHIRNIPNGQYHSTNNSKHSSIFQN